MGTVRRKKGQSKKKKPELQVDWDRDYLAEAPTELVALDPETPTQVIVTIHFDTDLTWWQALKFRLAGGRYWTDHMKDIVERQVREGVTDYR